MITRIAPTPSGHLHKGNLFNFLLNWLWARVNEGKVLLRIDDLDAQRTRPEYLDNIFRTLEQIGLDWDMGPSGPEDFMASWSQQKRQYLYVQILNELKDKNQVFACDCSRKTLAEYGEIYPGICLHKNLALDTEETSWRIKMSGNTNIAIHDIALGKTEIDVEKTTGSFVVRRRDGLPAYQVTSLADDLHFGVTHIARGMDLLPSTAMQLYLAGLLNKTVFLDVVFWHHGLLLDTKGEKISKSVVSKDSSGLLSGSKEELFADFARWMGWKFHGSLSLQELQGFALEDARFKA